MNNATAFPSIYPLYSEVDSAYIQLLNNWILDDSARAVRDYL